MLAKANASLSANCILNQSIKLLENSGARPRNIAKETEIKCIGQTKSLLKLKMTILYFILLADLERNI